MVASLDTASMQKICVRKLIAHLIFNVYLIWAIPKNKDYHEQNQMNLNLVSREKTIQDHKRQYKTTLSHTRPCMLSRMGTHMAMAVKSI